MARYWYAYDSVGNPFALSSYRLQNSTPGCINGPIVCAIYAPAGDEFPTILSENMRRYIANGLSNNVAEPATPADGDPRLASSYQLLKADSGTPRCSTGVTLCAINAPEGGPFPLSPLSQNLLDYIAAALANGVPQPELPLGSRLFVYLKGT